MVFSIPYMPFALCMVLVASAGCRQAAEQDNAADVAAIESMSKARAEAFNQGNAAGIARHFTEDGLLMAPGRPIIKGRREVASYYQHIFDQYATELESRYEEVKVSGDLAFGRGLAKVKLIARDGRDTLVSSAKYLNILQRQPDGSWLTTHDIWNENEAPAP